MLDEDPDRYFSWFEPNDFHQTSLRAGVREVSVEDLENLLEEYDYDTVYKVLST